MQGIPVLILFLNSLHQIQHTTDDILHQVKTAWILLIKLKYLFSEDYIYYIMSIIVLPSLSNN